MAGLLYHVPGASWLVPEAAHLQAAGLAQVLGGVPLEAQPCTGPDGPGVLLYSPQDPLELRGYHPDRQVWRRCSEGRRPKADNPIPSVGYWREARPGPDDLVRPRIVPGHLVELSGGGRWICPIGRMFDGRPGLPCAYLLEAGRLTEEVSEEYASLWADTIKLHVHPQQPDIVLIEIAHRALAVNYRLGTDELNLLRLLDNRNTVEVLGALLDHPTIQAVTQEVSNPKAKAAEASRGIPAGSNTGCGEPALCPDTPPASPTSVG